MPTCQDCSRKRGVKLSHDLLLCPACETIRFPPTQQHPEGNTTPPQSTDEVLETLAKIGSDIKAIKSSQDGVTQSINFMSSQFEKLRIEVRALHESNDQLKKDNDELRDRVAQLENETADLNQYHRRVNLEVSDIPEPEDGQEDTDKIVFNVLQKINPDIALTDIDITHRIGTKQIKTTTTTTSTTTINDDVRPVRHRPIIVRFTTRRQRNTIYDGRSKMKEVSTRDIGYEENNNIYINENLAPSGRALLSKANFARKGAGFKFLWTYNGRIYVKKSPSHNKITINHEGDISKIR